MVGWMLRLLRVICWPTWPTSPEALRARTWPTDRVVRGRVARREGRPGREERGDGGALQDAPPVLVDLVGEARRTLQVGRRHALQVHRVAVRQEETVPAEKDPLLAPGDHRVVLGEQAAALRHEQVVSGDRVVDVLSHLRDDGPGQVAVDGGDEDGGKDRARLDLVGASRPLQGAWQVVGRRDASLSAEEGVLVVLEVRIGGPLRRRRAGCAGQRRRLRGPGRGRRLGALLRGGMRRFEEDAPAARPPKGLAFGALRAVVGVGARERALAEAGVGRRGEDGSRARVRVPDEVRHGRRRRRGARLRARLQLGLGRVEGQGDREHAGARERREQGGDGARAQGARRAGARGSGVGRRARAWARAGRARPRSARLRDGCDRHRPFPVLTGRGGSAAVRAIRTIS